MKERILFVTVFVRLTSLLQPISRDWSSRLAHPNPQIQEILIGIHLSHDTMNEPAQLVVPTFITMHWS
jgi:hypothetical protein